MSPQRRIRITRDSVLFAAGLMGIAYETLISGTERATLLLLFAAMIGLPAFLPREREPRKEARSGTQEDAE